MLSEKIKRYKAMDKHMELTKKGRYRAANSLLILLRKGSVKLGLGEDDWEVESFLEGIGCRVNYSRSGYSATWYLRRR